jgi:hypothetical protein
MEERAAALPAQAGGLAWTRARRDAGLLLLLLLLAGGLRWWHLRHTEVTARDSVGFIRFACQLRQQPWRGVLRDNLHPPLYPLAVLGMSVPVGEFVGGAPSRVMQLSAQLVSVVAGVLLVLPLYVLGRDLFSPSVGFWAAALVQCLPASGRVLPDGLSEGLFLLLTATALLMAVRGLRHHSALCFALSGVCGGLAYLTRPEGLVVVASVGLVLLAQQLVAAWRRPWRRTLACAASLAAAAAAVGGPYVAVTGRLTNKTTGATILKLAHPEGTKDAAAEPPPGQPQTAALLAFWAPDYTKGPFTGRLWWSTKALAVELVKGFHYLALPAALLGLWWFRGRLKTERGTWVPLTLALVHFLVLWRVAVVMGYVSDRHIILLTMCTSFWAVAAVQELPWRLASLAASPEFARAMRRLNSQAQPARSASEGSWGLLRPLLTTARVSLGAFQRVSHLAEKRKAVVQFLLLLALVGFGLPSTLKPLHANRAGHHAAGLWIAAHAATGPVVVLDPYLWAEFYAGQGSLKETVAPLPPGYRPDYVVVARSSTNEHRRLQLIPDAEDWSACGRLVYHWPDRPTKVKAEPVDVYYVAPGPSYASARLGEKFKSPEHSQAPGEERKTLAGALGW